MKRSMCLKLTVCSAVFIILIALFQHFTTDKKDVSPEKVTVYLSTNKQIITLNYEEFLIGCIMGSGVPSYEEEALKAIACAYNTMSIYQLSSKNGFLNNGADFSDHGVLPYISPEEAKRTYKSSYDIYLKKAKNAVKYGISRVIMYENEPIYAAMCFLSSGVTDLSDKYPYLRVAQCPKDKKSELYESTRTFTPNQIRITLKGHAPAAKLDGNFAEWFSEPEYSSSGTLEQIYFGGAPISGKKLMNALGLESPAIEIRFSEDKFTFICHGEGGNLGISQYTANSLAQKGLEWREIIEYFYKDVHIEKI